jgi:hypothetical protein
MFKVVDAGIVTIGQLEEWTAFKKLGASSPPLAVTVQGSAFGG